MLTESRDKQSAISIEPKLVERIAVGLSKRKTSWTVLELLEGIEGKKKTLDAAINLITTEGAGILNRTRTGNRFASTEYRLDPNWKLEDLQDYAEHPPFMTE